MNPTKPPLYNQFQKISSTMFRNSFFRPLLHFRDPFEEDPFYFPMWDRPLSIMNTESIRPRNAMDTFNEFFDENKINEEEKEFFSKHYPEKVPE